MRIWTVVILTLVFAWLLGRGLNNDLVMSHPSSGARVPLQGQMPEDAIPDVLFIDLGVDWRRIGP